jgi:cyanate lyase
MDNNKEVTDNQHFIDLIKSCKKNGIFYSQIAKKANFPKDFIPNVLRGQSTASEYHVKKVYESFPEMDPDFKEENIVEAIKRIEQEKETIKAEIKELQAALFKMQAKCK